MESKRYGINYLYFGVFFALLFVTCTSSVLLKDNLAGSRLFFWFYSLGQAALEVSIFTFLAQWIYRFAGRLGFWLFIGFTFVLFFVHFFDFMMDRVLDSTVWSAFKIFILDESLENLYYLLEASGVPLWIWGVLFLLLVLLPIFGMLFYRGTSWFSQKQPLHVRNEVFLQLFVCIPAALFLWDYSASKVIHPDAYTEFVKSLPWKRTFLQPKTVQLPMGASLTPPKTEQEIEAFLANVKPAEKMPNVFLFIAESLRGDFLGPDVAPNLNRFREENIHAETALSNANATMISWFSIFYSEFPLYWQKLQQQNWKMGSPALALFKKLGYKIRVYSSAELHYYGMQDLLFGKEHSLVDSMQLFPHSPPQEAYKSDLAACTALKKDLEDPSLQQGQLIVVFFDGTHFDYSWPKELPAKFTPFATEFAYFKTFHSQTNIELIRNRYRNAVHYLDSLFGDLLKALPADSLIAFTGDHGEEFFDHGHLFHCSHIVDVQTSVPIYLRIPGHQKRVAMMSQMDIMPSLLDGVTGTAFPILEGESVLREKKWPFAAIARFNASRTPYEFCLHNGTNKITLQFANRKNIFDCANLRILSLRTAQEVSLREKQDEIEEYVYAEFGPALDRLFTK